MKHLPRLVVMALWWSTLTIGCGGSDEPTTGGERTGGREGPTGGRGGAAGTTQSHDGGSGGGLVGAGGLAGGGAGPVATSTGGAGGLAASLGGGAGGGTVSGVLYVATSGSDTDPGTMARPFRTLARARDAVREMTPNMTADVTVYVRGGTYPQTATLAFTNADGGKNGWYVKYLAYPGEKPLITGGRPITGWTPSSAGPGLYEANAGPSPFRQLYVNGLKAIRARSPNLGANGAFAFNRLTGADHNAQNIQIASSEIGNWKNLTKVEMHLMTGWGDNTLRLASFTTAGNTASLKIQSPEAGIVFVRPFPHLGGQFGGFTKHVYYFENALELLDQPGEWYLDETQGVVYYKPRTGEDMSKAIVVAPSLETVVSIKGTSTSEQVAYLWFQGLTFAHTNYLRPSQFGFCDAQAGQYNLTATSDNKQTIGRPPAGVTVTNAHHLHFERNVFTQMGATALDLVSGTHDDLIVGNVVADIAGNGISLGKFAASETTEFHVPYNPTDKNEICTNDTVKDNYIHHVTTEFQGGVAIAAGYPRQVDIEHNEVAYVNYSGISVGYGWTSSVNAMSNNRINANELHHVVQVMADGAALYTLSNQQPKSEMQYNYLHDYVSSPWADYGSNGIYLDEQTSGFTIAHNAMVNAPTNVVRNQNGTNSITDTPAMDPQAIKAMAGLEAAYADIKSLTAPLPTF